MSGSYFPSYSISYGFEMGGAVTIVFFVLALAAAIALVALFLPRNKRGFYTALPPSSTIFSTSTPTGCR